MKQLALMFVMLSGTISNHAFGDEYSLHFEDFLCNDVDFHINKDGQVVFPGAGEKRFKGQVVHGTEMLVQSGSRFFTKTVVGKKTTTIRGELKPLPEPGRFQLEFSREVTEASGSLLFDEIAPKKSSAIRSTVELNKPISLLGGTEKGGLILFSILLKPPKSPN